MKTFRHNFAAGSCLGFIVLAAFLALGGLPSFKQAAQAQPFPATGTGGAAASVPAYVTSFTNGWNLITNGAANDPSLGHAETPGATGFYPGQRHYFTNSGQIQWWGPGWTYWAHVPGSLYAGSSNLMGVQDQHLFFARDAAHVISLKSFGSKTGHVALAFLHGSVQSSVGMGKSNGTEHAFSNAVYLHSANARRFNIVSSTTGGTDGGANVPATNQVLFSSEFHNGTQVVGASHFYKLTNENYTEPILSIDHVDGVITNRVAFNGNGTGTITNHAALGLTNAANTNTPAMEIGTITSQGSNDVFVLRKAGTANFKIGGFGQISQPGAVTNKLGSDGNVESATQYAQGRLLIQWDGSTMAAIATSQELVLAGGTTTGLTNSNGGGRLIVGRGVLVRAGVTRIYTNAEVTGSVSITNSIATHATNRTTIAATGYTNALTINGEAVNVTVYCTYSTATLFDSAGNSLHAFAASAADATIRMKPNWRLVGTTMSGDVIAE